MSRTGGDKTKKKILAVAEELFSKNGFNATSINQITRAANVNKALVYYYFKDKNDLVISLFKEIMEELSDLDSRSAGDASPGKAADLGKGLKEEISFLDERKKILSVMLMEALKSDDRDSSLFQCAELVMSDHAHEMTGTDHEIVHEFFTGFVPLIAFVALRDKFCDYFRIAREDALHLFVECFLQSHVQTHPKQEMHDENRNS